MKKQSTNLTKLNPKTQKQNLQDENSVNSFLIGFLVWFIAATAPAQSVVDFYVAQFTGTTNDTTITIRAQDNPVIYHGIYYWWPQYGVTLNTTNGMATMMLIPSRYFISFAGIPRSWVITVTNSASTMNAANLTTDMVIYNGINTLSGAGVTNDGHGDYTVTGGGGSATNVNLGPNDSTLEIITNGTGNWEAGVNTQIIATIGYAMPSAVWQEFTNGAPAFALASYLTAAGYAAGWGSITTNILATLIPTNDNRILYLTNSASIYAGTFLGNATSATTANSANTATSANSASFASSAGTVSGAQATTIAQAAATNEANPVFFTNNANVLAGNGGGLVNYISWSQSATTNLSLAFNGTLQCFTLTNSAVNFTSFSGTNGSFSFLFRTTTPVTYPANTNLVRWLTPHPTIVTNGVINFSAFGTNVIAAYKECQ
jgi:hypothetical protein